jgi:hypothetical protein
MVRSCDAAFCAISLFTALGYYLSFDKVSVFPSCVLDFLGITVDSERAWFSLSQKRMAKIERKTAAALEAGGATEKDLQSIAGMGVSALLVVPGALLYSRALFRSLTKEGAQGAGAGGAFMTQEHARRLGRGRPVARHTGRKWVRIRKGTELHEDVTRWNDVRRVQGAPWVPPEHTPIEWYTDAAGAKWGATFTPPGHEPLVWASGEFPAYLWVESINVKEAWAVLQAMLTWRVWLKGARVLMHIDNTATIANMKNGGGRSEAMTKIMKDIFVLSQEEGCVCDPVYVNTKDNPADAPSRVKFSPADWQLAPAIFRSLDRDRAFGGQAGYSVDLMATDLNAQVGRHGRLPYFSFYSQPQAAGRDVLAQNLQRDEGGERRNGWCHPPRVMIGHLLERALRQDATMTLVVPYVPGSVARWWPVVWGAARARRRLALPGDLDVLLSPMARYEPQGLECSVELWAFALGPAPS